MFVLELDVTSDDSVKIAVAKAIELGGPLDVVVNNAGIGCGGLAEAFTAEQWQQVFDINVFGVQRVSRAVLPSMRERGTGLLINVSSIMGRVVLPFAAPYTATKFALEGMTEAYRYELSGTGVDVSSGAGCPPLYFVDRQFVGNAAEMNHSRGQGCDSGG